MSSDRLAAGIAGAAVAVALAFGVAYIADPSSADTTAAAEQMESAAPALDVRVLSGVVRSDALDVPLIRIGTRKRPPCVDSLRGAIVFVRGAPDAMEVCAADATGALAWRGLLR